MESKYIVWLDTELSGLNPQKDHILELGLIVTDWNLEEKARGSWVIQTPPSIIGGLAPFIRKMHTENNLIKEVEESTLTVEDVEVKAMRLLRHFFEKGAKFIMGGNSVYVDKLFVEHHMPLLDSLFHHRILDLINFRLACERWGPHIYEQVSSALPKDTPRLAERHRTISDLERSISYAKQYKEVLFKTNS